MAMWKIWNCQTLHKSLEITNALIAVLYTEITNAVHVMSHLISKPIDMWSKYRKLGKFHP